MIYNLFQLLRPHQWVKNGVVLAGLVFSGSASDSANILTALAATGLFCLLSSTVYIINDLVDAETDRHHPTKAKRPIASGRAGGGPVTQADRVRDTNRRDRTPLAFDTR